MKNITTFALFAVIAAISPSVFAAPALPVPDGGATALLLGIGTVGLISARRFFGKK